MNEKLILDEVKIKKIKKRVHKSLKGLGIEIKLSEVGNIIANSIGFKNEYELKKYCDPRNVKNESVDDRDIASKNIDPEEYKYFGWNHQKNDIDVICSENYKILTTKYNNDEATLSFHPNIVKIILNDVKIDEKFLNDIISHIYPKLSRNGSVLICGEEGTRKSSIGIFLDDKRRNEKIKEKNNFFDIVQSQGENHIKLYKDKKRGTFCSRIVKDNYVEQLAYFRNIGGDFVRLEEFNIVENIIVVKWNK